MLAVFILFLIAGVVFTIDAILRRAEPTGVLTPIGLALTAFGLAAYITEIEPLF